MIALQRQNPDAFIDNNVNRLRTGAILRLDDIAQVAEIPAEQASATYTAQLEAWEAERTRVASADSEPDTTVAAADTAPDAAATEQSTGQETADAGADTASSSSDQAAAAPETAAGAEGEDDVLRIVQATVDEAERYGQRRIRQLG